LTATFIMLLLDRHLDMHFFTNDLGGNQMLYPNLFWAWGHPEVYILVLPAFGIFSEIAPVFSGKDLFSYRSMVWATLGICILAFMVWLHHFFTMGAGADVNAFFGIMSSIIAVPTGVKVFNWLFTMFRGKIEFKSPMVWLVAFMITFVLGGLTGVLLAVPPVDFVLHNSVFLVAHFHNVIIGGVVFGAFAGYYYWFPKAFGFTLHEGWGKASIWFWVIGFYLAFVPLYMLGLMGMTRRLQHIPDPGWQPLLLVAEVGAILVFCGILCQIIQLFVSIRTRERRRDLTGDPWNGRTLEWSTSSPPPAYNFAVLPNVESVDAFWHMKRSGRRPPAEPAYEAIEMPHNSPAGFITAFFAVVMGFSLIWQIWWLAILGSLAVAVVVLIAGWGTEREQEVSAAELAQMERARGSEQPA
jgi:cytochrome o ubiquinol oxidase subunit 1